MAKLPQLDYAAEADRICERLRDIVFNQLHRRGMVVAMSGGIDSSCCAALAVRAFGKDRVFGILLPERDSSSASSQLGKQLAEHLGIPYQLHNIAPALEALGCYSSQVEAIQRTIPEFGPGWKFKLAISDAMGGKVSITKVVAEDPKGNRIEKRLPAADYLQIVAATNFKQRIRKNLEYYHADRLNYVCTGTPNRLEYDQGFFVKNGDGAADLKPIAHLYKTQVYAMARHLDVPEAICTSVPSTDTYSLAQGQDEFYFAMPYDRMDLALWSLEHDVPAADLAAALGLSPEQAELVYDDIRSKRRTTRPLHAPARLIEPVLGRDD